MDISVHDNRLLSYTVDRQEREIILRTAYLGREPHEYTDIIFSGVAAYRFVGDNFSTNIFDVAEVEPEDIYSRHREVFAEGEKYGWPLPYGSIEELLQRLSAENVKGYIISSSYGLDGWVWARELTLKQRVESNGEI
ncbi:MAG: hypothetical protein ACJ754_07060 [Pyrinomonadaceae bacterium]